MTTTTNGDKIGSILKADLMLSDYTLLTDMEERKSIIYVLDRYIKEIDDPKISIIFDRLTTTKDVAEKELYTEILMDIFSELKKRHSTGRKIKRGDIKNDLHVGTMGERQITPGVTRL